jgi:hypothetical protein
MREWLGVRAVLSAFKKTRQLSEKQSSSHFSTKCIYLQQQPFGLKTIHRKNDQERQHFHHHHGYCFKVQLSRTDWNQTTSNAIGWQSRTVYRQQQAGRNIGRCGRCWGRGGPDIQVQRRNYDSNLSQE